MSEDNLLKSWITAEVDEIQSMTDLPKEEKSELLDKVHRLLAQPHTHANNNSLSQFMHEMTHTCSLYNGALYVLLHIRIKTRIHSFSNSPQLTLSQWSSILRSALQAPRTHTGLDKRQFGRSKSLD